MQRQLSRHMYMYIYYHFSIVFCVNDIIGARQQYYTIVDCTDDDAAFPDADAQCTPKR